MKIQESLRYVRKSNGYAERISDTMSFSVNLSVILQGINTLIYPSFPACFMRITISGKPGAGKSTIARILAKELGLKYVEMGKIAQEIALRRKTTVGELMQQARNDSSIDAEIDAAQKHLGEKEDDFVIDGRISFYFIPNAVHVFLDVDEQVAAERIFKKPREPDEPAYVSVDEVQRDIHARMIANQEQYKKYYGIDYLDKKNYALVIDTSKKTAEEIVQEILKRVKGKKKNV